MEEASQPTKKYDDYLNFEENEMNLTFTKEDEDLLDIIYQREKTTEAKKPSINKKLQPEVSFVAKVLDQLDKLDNRLFIIGLIASMIVSFIVFKLLTRKPAQVSSTNTAKNNRKNK